MIGLASCGVIPSGVALSLLPLLVKLGTAAVPWRLADLARAQEATLRRRSYGARLPSAVVKTDRRQCAGTRPGKGNCREYSVGRES